MEVAEVHELIDRVAGFDLGCATAETVAVDLGVIARLSSWLEAMTLSRTRRLAELSVVSASVIPEIVVAEAQRVDHRHAQRTTRRVTALDVFPELGAALSEGRVSGGHLDVVAGAVQHLEPPTRTLLAERGGFLAGVATRSTPDQFAKTLRQEIGRLDRGHENTVFERQRRATFLRHWTDQVSGMVCVRGEFDPESGARLIRRLADGVDRLFHAELPDTCPADPSAKQDHLRALALVHLTDANENLAVGGDGADAVTGPVPVTTTNVSPRRFGDGGVDLIIVTDHQTLVGGLHQHSILDPGAPVELPVDTIRRLACTANIIPAVLNGDGVLLDLGRSVRLANRNQRRALRVMYPTCAIPGCGVLFDRCDPHHLTPWESLGPTDLDNLLPLCSRHHHAAHEGGWQLTLGSDRTLTITTPDGHIQTTGPPRRRAA